MRFIAAKKSMKFKASWKRISRRLFPAVKFVLYENLRLYSPENDSPYNSRSDTHLEEVSAKYEGEIMHEFRGRFCYRESIKVRIYSKQHHHLLLGTNFNAAVQLGLNSVKQLFGTNIYKDFRPNPSFNFPYLSNDGLMFNPHSFEQ